MAQFKAGDMITGKLTMSDGKRQRFAFMVNRVIEDAPYGPAYSLDDGNGQIDGRATVAEIDKDFKLC